MIGGYQIIDFNEAKPIVIGEQNCFAIDGKITGKPLYVVNYKEVQEGYDDVTYPYIPCFHDGNEEDSEGVYIGFRFSDSGTIRALFVVYYDDELEKIIFANPAD